MASESTRIKVPLNRAEGDLEIQIEVAGGTIVDAWSSGTMFRGFEGMMKGRGALDGLVLTPRICGICSLTHLTAAVEALDAITGIRPPDNAQRLRNLALMVETVQSDVRHAVLMFMVDFANQKAYHDHPMIHEAMKRYAPLAGNATIQTIRETKRLLEVVAIIGGQWPHTSFMVPGGVTSSLDVSEILQCRIIVSHFLNWYERSILGCSVERWQAVTTGEELDRWLEETETHRESEVGFFLRFGRLAGLDNMGRGHNRFLSYGNFPLPQDTDVPGTNGRLTAAGFAESIATFTFEQEKIREDVSHSWYEGPGKAAHPFDGDSRPYASGEGGGPYSWVKAPRYDGLAVETGPLAERIMDKDLLFQDLVRLHGPNVLVRELARLTRPAKLLPVMLTWLQELQDKRGSPFYNKIETIPDGDGAGLIQAARGALGHWIKVVGEKITHYQIITPSAWHGSPRDHAGSRGPWEEALIGTPIRDESSPVEAGHVVRSFDPCLVCAVHTVRKGKKRGSLTLG